jgi:hypothetical protein
MPSIAIQGVLGAPGRKPVTEVPVLSMESLGSINGFSFGCGKEGFFKLNAADLPDGETASFTLNTSHLGYPGNLKKNRYLYSAMDGDISGVTVLAAHDDSDPISHTKCTPHGRGFRASIGSRCQGVYWTFGISSTKYFSIDSLSLLLTVRSSGVGG